MTRFTCFCNLSNNVRKSLSLENGSGMDREWIENGSAFSHKLFASILFLLFIGVGSVWGTTGAITANRTVILPAGNTTDYASAYWTAAGAPAYSTSNDDVKTMTVSGSSVGTLRFYHAGYSGWLQLQASNGYVETVISSTEGVDVYVYMKSNAAAGTITATLTWAGGSSSQSVTGTTAAEKTISTTQTSATLKITTSSNAGQIGYIKIVPKAKFTVTFYNAYGKSTPSAVTQTTGGGSVTIPSALPSDDCAEKGWEFAGWKMSSYQTSDASYMNGLIPAGSYIPGGDESFYAVFRKEGDATSTSYTCESTSGTDKSYSGTTAAGGFTITYSKGNSENYYAGAAPWRLYKDGSQLIVSGSNPISSLALVHNSTNYGSFTSSVVGSTVTMASSSGGTTTVSDINANSVTLTSGGSKANYISSVTVYYTAYTYRSNPVCVFDYFIDIMHDKVVADQSGTYSMPAITGGDADKGDTYCDELHYHFLGWVEESDLNENGTLKDGYTLYPAGDAGHTAANKTFYAIWGKEE